MRKLAISLALASTALASPALARDDQWYVGVDGGAMLVEDFDLGVSAAGPVGGQAVTRPAGLDTAVGYDFGGVVGYDFGGFRLESEVSFREADITSTVSNGLVPSTNGNGLGGPFAPGVIATNGDANALSFMVNGMLDFGADDGLQGFVGGGVGVARVDIHNVYTAVPWLDDSDTGFAWQAIAGIRAPLSDHWDVGLKYRFFNVNNVDLVDRLNRNVSTDWRSHSLMGSLVYNFGGEPAEVVEVAAPPPPPYVPEVAPPPPPPPPPPPLVCQSGPYIVFFDWDKSNLDATATSTLDNAAAQYANCGNARVMLAGHADRSGSTKYNVGLSQRRNAEVQAYLQTRGVPGGVMSADAFGESQNATKTADGVREAQNRRVEVNYGPGSGN